MNDLKEQKSRSIKQLLIYPRFQLPLILGQLGTLFLVFIAVGVQHFRSFNQMKSLGQSIQLPPTHIFFEYLDYLSKTSWSYAMIGFLGSALLSTLLSLWISHKIAGPLVRMKRELNQMIETGEFREIKFRKHDHFLELPELLNQALTRVTETVRRKGA